MSQPTYTIQARAGINLTPDVPTQKPSRYRAEWLMGAWYVMAVQEDGHSIATASDAFLFEVDARAEARRLNEERFHADMRGTIRMFGIAVIVLLVWALALRAMELL